MTRSQNQLCLHSGGGTATIDEVKAVETPDSTDTYSPVAHDELLEIVRRHADTQLHDYTFVDEAFGLSPRTGENMGAKLFAVMSYKADFSDDLGLSIGVRNSTDQSLSVGVCMGAKVFVCDNLCFSGDIRIQRKHTGDVLADVERMIAESMEIAPMRHRSIHDDAETMKEHDVNDDEAYALLGMAYGRSILRPRQLLGAREAWKTPPQDDFKDRNLWSLYNAMTEALKSASPKHVLESHSRAHALMMNQGLALVQGMGEFRARQVA
jgi:hypothetical protein